MGMVMGMRGIRPDLEGWQLDLASVRSRMYLAADTPGERNGGTHCGSCAGA